MMDRAAFLKALQEQLRRLPEQERQQSLHFYDEMIDDRMEEGMEEQAAVAALGDPGEIARQVLMELSLPKLVKTRLRPSGSSVSGRLYCWFWEAPCGFRCSWRGLCCF